MISSNRPYAERVSALIGDPARLKVLEDYEILDSPPEPRFDDLVTVAREICGTQVALVTFVLEDRQWFKARAGVDVDETPISHSVCAHAIAQGATLIIPDLSRDDRTKDNPLVTGEPFIRFYAGALLRTPTGEDLGTLCVIDTKPRPEGLTHAQTLCLEALARQVVQLMELRRLIAVRDSALTLERISKQVIQRRANENQERSDVYRAEMARAIAAQEAGRIGSFEANVDSGTFYCTAEMCRIFGLPEVDEYPASVFEALVVPEDRGFSSDAGSRADGTAPAVTEYRIRRADDGAIRWLTRRADYVRDDAGRLVAFTGTVHDITERKSAELRQSALVRLGDEIRDATSGVDIVRSTARVLGETLDLTRAGYARIDADANLLATDIDWTSENASSAAGSYPVQAFAETIAQLKLGGPVIVADCTATKWLAGDLPGYEALGIRAHITVPLTQRGKLVGILFAHSAVPRDWSAEEVAFLQEIADRAYGGIARTEAEDRQRGLNKELSHRLKNTLALVQAIATRTLRNVADKTTLDSFQDRLVALSKAHDVLLDRDWRSGRIRDVVDAVLPVHIDAGRVDISGPNILIGSRAVLSLSMLLHELATNAVKHGALSADGGRVSIGWKVDTASATADLFLSWDETGGPAVAEPKNRGMGSRLIEAGLAGTGGSVVRYQVSGLRAEFRASLTQLVEG